MGSESFLVTALPHSADPAAAFHVSLFVTHRLTPEADEGHLEEFPTAVEWGRALLTGAFRLSGSDGEPIPVTPLVGRVAPDLWSRVFPPDLTVRPWRTPDLTAVPWRTFPAHKMDGYGNAFHALAVFASPVANPPLTEGVFPALLLGMLASAWEGFTPVLQRFVRTTTRRDRKALFEEYLDRNVFRGDSGDPRGRRALRGLELVDQRVTAWLDDLTQGGTVVPDLGEPPEDSFFPSVPHTMVDLHLARRYYERPEEQRPYEKRPLDPPPPHDPPAPPDPDFHQRCTLLADTPGVLRQLGLVVDLRVDDLSRLDGLEWIRGDISIPGAANTIRVQPAVTCRASGTAFSSVSSTGDFDGGALRLGDESRYKVLDLDPDATGLKLERFLRSLPRVLYSALNGDPAHGAPATLRSSGFSIARRDRASGLRSRLTDAAVRDRELVAGSAAPLDAEAVTRGLRLEVWDDVSETWHTLHRRSVDVEIAGDVVFDGEHDVGFLQGAALTRADETVSNDPNRPYHAHEVLAGWEGWSLSAPPPGKVVVDETQDPGDPPEGTHVTPVVVRSKAWPGSLPRLRYGRSYAFRAWAVDLAGNSPPASASTGGAPLDPDRIAAAVEELRGLRGGRDAEVDELSRELRRRLLAARGEGGDDDEGRVDAVRRDDGERSPIDALGRLVRARFATRGRRPAERWGSRAERIDLAVREMLETDVPLTAPTTAGVPPASAAAAIGSAAATRLGVESLEVAGTVASEAELVTSPRPFLRWDAVLPPVWVPRHPFKEGESLHTLVVRTGVSLDAHGRVALTPYGVAEAATSERHLAPPKTSQLDSERHGMFDAALGPSATAAQRKTALAVALREAGTFLDRTIAHPSNPGQRVPQPGVQLHNAPTADPDTLVSLDDIENDRGRPLAPGQYVVHDVDALTLPYLPDPLADGVTLLFPDAGRDHRVGVMFAVEGVTVPFRGAWPDRQPHRLVLEGGSELAARVDAPVITISVPPGERLRMKVSTSLTPAGLDLLGLWRTIGIGFQGEELVDAARDGWFWWLTPSDDVQLVHALPRPLERPRVPFWEVERDDGDTDAVLVGLVDVHGPSTERLDIEARWTEPVDDPAKDGPEVTVRTGVAGHVSVAYDEDLVLLGRRSDVGTVTPLPDGGHVVHHLAVHNFEDTRHRMVDYTVRATTRYREFFPPMGIEDLSLVSEPVRASVPSSARPPKPVVRDVLPLFRWSEGTEPAQPFGVRRSRRSGLRIYLERPWFATGEGELLGVLLQEDEAARGYVSEWAADPVWRQQGPEDAPYLPLVDELDLFAVDERDEPGRPVVAPARLPLVDVRDEPEAVVLGYRPEFSKDRKLWFVDIAFHPGTAFWPFIRLAVARYQPESRPGLHLSPTVVCDFAQLTPERTATVTRPDSRRVRVIVTGAVGEREETLSTDAAEAGGLDRAVIARLEQRDAAVDTDLGWVTVAVQVLPVRGREGWLVWWGDVLELPEAVPPRRPGEESGWRIAVEEWEFFPADGPTRDTLRRAGRIVYADHVPL